MPPSPNVCRAAIAAGVPARFVYWAGRSGRRYVFTCTGAMSLSDFEDGVAIAVSRGEIVWSGHVTALARMPADAAPRQAAIYLHLLATTLQARRAVIDDLRPAEPDRLRLAA